MFITDYVRDGSISISLNAADGRPFCIGIRVIQRLTVDQVEFSYYLHVILGGKWAMH